MTGGKVLQSHIITLFLPAWCFRGRECAQSFFFPFLDFGSFFLAPREEQFKDSRKRVLKVFIHPGGESAKKSYMLLVGGQLLFST